MNRNSSGCVAGALMSCLLVMVSGANVQAQQAVALPVTDRMLTGTPPEVFSVGRAVGQSWEMFSRIRDLAFDAEGSLYILDSGNRRVVVLDRTGRFLREFGSRGQGPGEFQTPYAITISSNNEVVVNDVGNRALIFLSRNGDYLKQVSLAEISDRPRRIRAASDGRIVSLSTGRQTPEGRFAHLYVLPAQTGDPHVELARAPLPEMIPIQMRSREMGITGMRRSPVFSPEAYFAVASDGATALQTDAGYALQIFDVQGRHARTIARALPEMPTTEEIRDAWLQEWSEIRVELGSSAELPYDPPFADVMSQVTGLAADRSGRIWVRRRVANGDTDGIIDLVTTAGQYIGSIRDLPLPSAFGPDGVMAFIVTDDMDVEHVVVRREPATWQ